MSPAPDPVVQRRKETGAHNFDEMWDGELRMVPSPTRIHQDLEWALETYLRTHWAPRHGARVYHQINVARRGCWPNDYRIPDVVLLAPDRFAIDRNEYFDGAPTVVVEIRSPRDDTDAKLPFYASLGIPETWVVDRDTKRPELYSLVDATYERGQPDAKGWLRSAITGIALRPGSEGKLRLHVNGDPDSDRDIP